MDSSTDSSPAETSDAPAGEAPYPSERYAWFVVIILMIVYIFSFLDRQILNLLAPVIQEDWDLSEKSLSYLMGIYFALFYTIFGFPIGRMADSKSRRGLIGIGLALWSLMTTACGLAQQYWQMAMFRLGVGVGEATLSPSAYSLITDYFRPTRLSLAISIYGAGIYLGSGLAYLLGGIVFRFAGGVDLEFPVIGAIRPWQSVFLMIGIPGFLFTLMMFAIKEPTRRGIKKSKDGKEDPVTILEVIRYVGQNWRTVLTHNVGFALLSFISYGSTAWMSIFFQRTHGWAIPDIGIRYGTVVMIFGTAGILFGGWLAAQLARKGYVDSKMRVGVIAAIAHIPLGIIFPLMPNGWLAILVLCPSVFTVAMPFGVAPAAILEIMPNRMRGQASAVYLFIVNSIGLGLGPTAVAFITEDVFADPSKVRYSMLIVSTVAGIAGATLLFIGMRQFRHSMERLKDWHGESEG